MVADDSRAPRLWRRLPWHNGDAAAALAGAEALLEGVASGGRPAIRWYITPARALLLGASQREQAVDAAACRAAGIPVYRRAAGGAAVLVDEDTLGLDVVLPRGDPLLLSDLTQSYRWLGEVWTVALRTLGVDAAWVDVATARADARAEGRAAELARLACFGGLSPYEVTAQGHKVVGLAQVRRRYGALFQVAVLLRMVPRRLAALLAVPSGDRATLSAALCARMAGLDDVAAHPVTPAQVVAACEGELAARGIRLVEDAWTASEQAATRRLLEERYRPLYPLSADPPLLSM